MPRQTCDIWILVANAVWNKLPMTKASKKKWSTIQEEIKLLPWQQLLHNPLLWLDPRSWQRINPNQIHPSPGGRWRAFVKPNLCCWSFFFIQKSKETLNPNRGGGGGVEFHLEKPSSLLDANIIHRRLAHWKTLASARADPTPERNERHLEEQRW